MPNFGHRFPEGFKPESVFPLRLQDITCDITYRMGMVVPGAPAGWLSNQKSNIMTSALVFVAPSCYIFSQHFFKSLYIVLF